MISFLQILSNSCRFVFLKENIMNSVDLLSKIKDTVPTNVKIVAVSKTKPATTIELLYSKSGQRLFGENKVQELEAKHEILPPDIEWHFIGHLQSNKIKYIAPFVSLIHGVDSLKLGQSLAKVCRKKVSPSADIT